MTKKTLTSLFHRCEETMREADDWRRMASSDFAWVGARMDAAGIAASLARSVLDMKTKINLELSRTEQATGSPKRYEDLVGVCCHNCAPCGAFGRAADDL